MHTLLGHKSLATTARYTHVDSSPMPPGWLAVAWQRSRARLAVSQVFTVSIEQDIGDPPLDFRAVPVHWLSGPFAGKPCLVVNDSLDLRKFGVYDFYCAHSSPPLFVQAALVERLSVFSRRFCCAQATEAIDLAFLCLHRCSHHESVKKSEVRPSGVLQRQCLHQNTS